MRAGPDGGCADTQVAQSRHNNEAAGGLNPGREVLRQRKGKKPGQHRVDRSFDHDRHNHVRHALLLGRPFYTQRQCGEGGEA